MDSYAKVRTLLQAIYTIARWTLPLCGTFNISRAIVMAKQNESILRFTDLQFVKKYYEVFIYLFINY